MIECVCVCVCTSVCISAVSLSLCHLSKSVWRSWIHLALSPICLSPISSAPSPPYICLSVAVPLPSPFFSQSGALLLLYCMAERLLRCSLCRGGRHTCTQRSVQPVTFGAALQPSLRPEVTEIAHTQTLRPFWKPGSFAVRLDQSKRAKIRHNSS